MNNIKSKDYGKMSLIFAFLPVVFFTLSIVIAFAFSQSGLILGGLLTYVCIALIPISNCLGFIYGIKGVTKKDFNKKVIIGVILNCLFIILYIIYLVDWIRHGF